MEHPSGHAMPRDDMCPMQVTFNVNMLHYRARQQHLKHRVVRLAAAFERQHLLRSHGGGESSAPQPSLTRDHFSHLNPNHPHVLSLTPVRWLDKLISLPLTRSRRAYSESIGN